MTESRPVMLQWGSVDRAAQKTGDATERERYEIGSH